MCFLDWNVERFQKLCLFATEDDEISELGRNLRHVIDTLEIYAYISS